MRDKFIEFLCKLFKVEVVLSTAPEELTRGQKARVWAVFLAAKALRYEENLFFEGPGSLHGLVAKYECYQVLPVEVLENMRNSDTDEPPRPPQGPDLVGSDARTIWETYGSSFGARLLRNTAKDFRQVAMRLDAKAACVEGGFGPTEAQTRQNEAEG